VAGVKSVLVAFVALFALSACTPEERAAVIRDYAAMRTETAETATPTADASADCAQITFTVNAPAGTRVFVNLGSDPPGGFTMDVTSMTASVPVGYHNTLNGYDWSIDVVDQATTRLASGSVACP